MLVVHYSSKYISPSMELTQVMVMFLLMQITISISSLENVFLR